MLAMQNTRPPPPSTLLSCRCPHPLPWCHRNLHNFKVFLKNRFGPTYHAWRKARKPVSGSELGIKVLDCCFLGARAVRVADNMPMPVSTSRSSPKFSALTGARHGRHNVTQLKLGHLCTWLELLLCLPCCFFNYMQLADVLRYLVSCHAMMLQRRWSNSQAALRCSSTIIHKS